MRTAAVALLTLVLGFALGWSLKSAPPPAESGIVTTHVAPDPVASPLVPRTPSTPTPSRDTSTLEHRVRQLTADKAAAEARVAELEAKLDIAHDVTAQLEGHPVPWPSGVDARYEEPAFLAALNAAIRDEKLSGQVRGIDCTEFPCIAHGQLDLDNPRDHAKLERLFAAMKTKYPGADFYLSQTVYTEDPNGNDPAQQRFSMSFFPKAEDEAAQSDFNVRLRSRKNAYVDAE